MFPVIETIDDVRPFVEGRREFVIAEREWGTVIDYQIMQPDSFDTSQARECRGIKFRKNGTLLARPYHKFHNFGEPQMNVADLASSGRFHDHFIILDKLDGSMIHPIIHEDKVFFCTRMGITDVAEQALAFVNSINGDSVWYLDFCYDLAKSGMTPMFEWCSRKNRIVLDYPTDQLILTAIRENRTGKYVPYHIMQALSGPYKIPMVRHWEGEWSDIHEFLKMVHSIEEAEGYVLRWDDGMMGKSKGEWYLQIHKAQDHISHEKRVIGLILNDNLDDVLPFLLASDYDRVLQYRDDFWKTIDTMVVTLDTRVGLCRKHTDKCEMDPKEAKKWFAVNAALKYTGVLSPVKTLLFDTWRDWDDEDITTRDVVIAFFHDKFALNIVGAKANGTDAVVQQFRNAFLLPEKDWRDY